jgi:hypothetical protein
MKEKDLLNLTGVRLFLEGDLGFYDLPAATRDALYEFYLPDMPYGTAKARTGDPDVFILRRLEKL